MGPVFLAFVICSKTCVNSLQLSVGIMFVAKQLMNLLSLSQEIRFSFGIWALLRVVDDRNWHFMLRVCFLSKHFLLPECLSAARKISEITTLTMFEAASDLRMPSREEIRSCCC